MISSEYCVSVAAARGEGGVFTPVRPIARGVPMDRTKSTPRTGQGIPPPALPPTGQDWEYSQDMLRSGRYAFLRLFICVKGSVLNILVSGSKWRIQERAVYQGSHPPPRSGYNFLCFHTVFEEKLAKILGWYTHL